MRLQCNIRRKCKFRKVGEGYYQGAGSYRREEETSNVKVTYSKKRHRGLAKGKKEEEEASTIDDTSPSHIKRSHKRHLRITDDVTI